MKRLLEEMNNKFTNIADTAMVMADTFEEHAMYVSGVAHITDTGWQYLSDIYGEVPMELRASIYNDFAKELTRRGIEYDPVEFANGSVI
jgi:hypothetical protein